MSIRLKVWISPAAAIMAGKATIRDQIVELDDAFIASLDEPERRELVNVVTDEGQVIGRSFKLRDATERRDAPMSEPTLDAVRTVLLHRSFTRAEFNAKLQHDKEFLEAEQQGKAEILGRYTDAQLVIIEGDDPPRISDDLFAERDNPFCKDILARADALHTEATVRWKAREAEWEAVRQHENAQREVQRQKGLANWVKTDGDDDQKARWKEGHLPAKEILDEVRADLFGYEGGNPYTPITAGDVCECSCMADVTFTVDHNCGLTKGQFELLERLRDNAPDGATVEVRHHTAMCPSCDCSTVTRYSAKVSVDWNGFALARVYLLDT